MSITYGTVMIQPEFLPECLRVSLGINDAPKDHFIAIKELLKREATLFSWQQCYWNTDGNIVFIGCSDRTGRGHFYPELLRTFNGTKVVFTDTTSGEEAYTLTKPQPISETYGDDIKR